MRKIPYIYYIAFPSTVFFLCCFSFYLGWTRGQQSVGLEKMEKNSEPPPTERFAADLTYFSVLRADEPIKIPTPSIEPSPQSRSSFYVQLNAFKDIRKARELVDQLKKNDFRATVRSNVEKRGWYRVYVGGFHSRDAASQAVKKIAEQKYGKGFIVESKE